MLRTSETLAELCEVERQAKQNVESEVVYSDRGESRKTYQIEPEESSHVSECIMVLLQL